MADTPKKDAVDAIGIIESSSAVLEALEAIAGIEDAAAAKTEAMADIAARGGRMPSFPTTADNDVPLAWQAFLRKYIKNLIAKGALRGDISKVF